MTITPIHPAPVLHAALELAQAGVRILPCKWAGPQAKAPLIRNGKDAATTDHSLIESWWQSYPRALIGMVVPIGMIVVDVDPQHGGSRASLEHGRGDQLPDTLTSWSGRGTGGCHMFFQHPGIPLDRAGLPPGIDLLEGGKHYVIAPPSLHPDTGDPYRWERHYAAPLPGFLLAMLMPSRTRPPSTTPRPSTRPTSVSSNRMSYWLDRVANAPEGRRNGDLFWVANTARRAGVLDDVEQQLIDAARSAGLDDREITKTLQSARRYTT